MREILFKGKEMQTKRWAEGYIKVYHSGRAEIMEESSIDGMFGFCEVAPETVCQYTGKKDRKGVKIFEKDIVRMPHESSYFIVEWIDSAGAFMLVGKGKLIDFEYCWEECTEVVGNVFDNREK